MPLAIFASQINVDEHTDCVVKIPVEARFSAPLQTRPGAHPTPYTVGTGSFPGVRRSGRGVDHPPPPSAVVKERVELFLYSPPAGPSQHVQG